MRHSVYSVLIAIVAVFLANGVPSRVSAAACEVRDVLDMVERGYSRTEIREECDEIDVEDCSLTQVIRMAEDEESVRDIYKQCGR